jgi:hypothetical protein
MTGLAFPAGQDGAQSIRRAIAVLRIVAGRKAGCA